MTDLDRTEIRKWLLDAFMRHEPVARLSEAPAILDPVALWLMTGNLPTVELA